MISQRTYSKIVNEMQSVLVNEGFREEKARLIAPTLCNIYEDMRLEKALDEQGKMPASFRGLEGKVDSSTPEKLGISISQEQFNRLGHRYAEVLKKYVSPDIELIDKSHSESSTTNQGRTCTTQKEFDTIFGTTPLSVDECNRKFGGKISKEDLATDNFMNLLDIYENSTDERTRYKAESQLCRLSSKLAHSNVIIYGKNGAYIPSVEHYGGWKIPHLRQVLSREDMTRINTLKELQE